MSKNGMYFIIVMASARDKIPKGRFQFIPSFTINMASYSNPRYRPQPIVTHQPRH